MAFQAYSAPSYEQQFIEFMKNPLKTCHLNGLLGNRYQYVKLIATSNYGSICEFIDTNHYKCLHVAIKIVLPEYKDIAIQEIAFMKILQFNKSSLSSNQNSPFCKLYNTFVYQEHVCIVMELLEGSLYSYYYDNNNSKPLGIDEALKIITPIIHCLAECESKTIIYADIKPDNICYNKNNQFELIDYGNCVMFTHRHIYYENYNLQSIAYRSPEVLFGLNSFSYNIDSWSIGCILYELISGEILFANITTTESLFTLLISLFQPFPFELFKDGKFYQLYYDYYINNNNLNNNNNQQQQSLLYKISKFPYSIRNLLLHTLCLNPMERWSAKDILYYYFIELKDPYIPIRLNEYDLVDNCSYIMNNNGEKCRLLNGEIDDIKSLEMLRIEAEKIEMENENNYYIKRIENEVEILNKEYKMLLETTDIGKDKKMIDSIQMMFDKIKNNDNYTHSTINNNNNYEMKMKYINEAKQYFNCYKRIISTTTTTTTTAASNNNNNNNNSNSSLISPINKQQQQQPPSLFHSQSQPVTPIYNINNNNNNRKRRSSYFKQQSLSSSASSSSASSSVCSTPPHTPPLPLPTRSLSPSISLPPPPPPPTTPSTPSTSHSITLPLSSSSSTTTITTPYQQHYINKRKKRLSGKNIVDNSSGGVILPEPSSSSTSSSLSSLSSSLTNQFNLNNNNSISISSSSNGSYNNNSNSLASFTTATTSSSSSLSSSTSSSSSSSSTFSSSATTNITSSLSSSSFPSSSSVVVNSSTSPIFSQNNRNTLINKIKQIYYEVKEKINKNKLQDCEVIYNNMIDIDIHDNYLNIITHSKLNQIYNKLEQINKTCDIYIHYIDTVCLTIKELEEIVMTNNNNNINNNNNNNSYIITPELSIEIDKEIKILQGFLSQLVKNTSKIPISDLYISVENSISEIKKKINYTHYVYCYNNLVSKFNQCKPQLLSQYNNNNNNSSNNSLKESENIENQINEIGFNIENRKFEEIDKSISDVYKLLPCKISSPIHTHSLPKKRRKKNESNSN